MWIYDSNIKAYLEIYSIDTNITALFFIGNISCWYVKILNEWAVFKISLTIIK